MRRARPFDRDSLVARDLVAALALVAAVVIVTAPTWHRGLGWYFQGSDPRYFLEVARAPFGRGEAFRRIGFSYEASYRYGRIGYPLLGWVLALGHPPSLMFTLELTSVAAIVAIPLMSMALLDAYGVPSLGGLCTAFVPALFLLTTRAYSDAVLVAALLLGFLLEACARRRSAQAVFAYAALVKETAILAIAAMCIRALRRGKRREAAGWALAVVPYGTWVCWVRVRVGAFPFLANDPSRRDALSAPLVAIVHVWRTGSSGSRAIVLIVLPTVVLAVLVAWKARWFAVAGTTAAFALFALCSGPATLPYPGDTLRVLMVPQVLGIICAVCAWSRSSVPAKEDNALVTAGTAATP